MSGCGWRIFSDLRRRLSLEPLDVTDTARELTWLNLGNDRGVEELTGSSVLAEQRTGSRKGGVPAHLLSGAFRREMGRFSSMPHEGADP